MALKLKFIIISAIYLFCNQIYETEACHLDHMKQYAMHSCELLIEAVKRDLDETDERLKREIFDDHGPSNSSYYDESRHVRPVHLKVKHSDFPAGGYIVLDHLYAKILRHVYPSTYHILPKKRKYRRYGNNSRQTQDTRHDGNTMSNDIPYRRRKRHHDDKIDEGINMTYCCMHRCRPYDLCEV